MTVPAGPDGPPPLLTPDVMGPEHPYYGKGEPAADALEFFLSEPGLSRPLRRGVRPTRARRVTTRARGRRTRRAVRRATARGPDDDDGPQPGAGSRALAGGAA